MMASCHSEFQLAKLEGRMDLQQHHLLRKKCRVQMHQDIICVFWTIYKQETWNRLNEVAGNHGMMVKDMEAFSLKVSLSVNENEIAKLWHEKFMLMYLTAEQHEMVPLHDCWVESQFKDREDTEGMKRLHMEAEFK